MRLDQEVDLEPETAVDPVTYARGHRLFEDRSDQRAMVVDWLIAQLAERRGADRLSVLSAGCGDGSVDAALAASLAGSPGSPGAPGSMSLRWTGIDPHPPVIEAFVRRLEALPDPPTVQGLACPFDNLAAAADGPTYDVITFVHSLYYVADLDDTLSDALDRLTPGGELLVLHAPLGDLNQLVAELAPPVAGHPQPWSGEVEAALSRLPVDVRRTELTANVDLSDAEDADPALLEFTVQSRLGPDQRRLVLDRLARMSLPGKGCRVPHPVNAYRITPLT